MSEIASGLPPEVLWQRSRSGARAGSGFRFQDAAATAAAVLCWAGRIPGVALVPESLDDFAVECQGATLYVQTKSKISDSGRFPSSEMAAILSRRTTAEPAEGSPFGAVTSVVLIDRPFENQLCENWARSIGDTPSVSATLRAALSVAEPDRSDHILSRSALITWRDPLAIAANEIAVKRSIPLAAAMICVHRLSALVGQKTDFNAGATYELRAKLTIGEVEQEIDRTLNLIDLTAVNLAVRKGIAEHIDFGYPLEEPGYYLGVATQAGHVAAGLTIPRHTLTNGIIDTLLRARRVVLVGPSGTGKSAAAFMAAFETRHAYRWIQVRRCSAEEQEEFLRFLEAQAASEHSPIVLYVDNAGGDISNAWQVTLEASLSKPWVYVVASVREENLSVLPGLTHCQQVRPTLDESFAEKMWLQLKEDDATEWASWQEPFERAKGLLLEYAHILTQGRRLQDLISEQVTQRLAEKRDGEFEVLRVTSAASSLGASVSVALLRDRLGMTNADCARALQRLVNEHLVRRVGDDEIAGMHELRSHCIFQTCLSLAPGTVADARLEALNVISTSSARTFHCRDAACARDCRRSRRGLGRPAPPRHPRSVPPDRRFGRFETFGPRL
jgi:hypothetical protein